MADRRMTTQIYINAINTGGTEEETQRVIDSLQARGWNVVWGNAPSRFCDAREEAAFAIDFCEVMEAL